jgi:hypothetical protein
LAVWKIRITFVVENETKTHYKTMKKQISTQLKANLRKMGKEWAAAKTFWSRQNDDLLFVEFPKDSPLEDKVLKAQAAFEERSINAALASIGCAPIRVEFRKLWF